MVRLIFIILLSLAANVNPNSFSIEETEFKLYRVLDFIERRYEQFHFDGLFGITFAHAFLIKSLQNSLQDHINLDVAHLIKKCINIRNEIYPLLPDSPKYMITFRNVLLNAQQWSKILPNQFAFGKITKLGYYKNWTADTIIYNKRAVYKGVQSDVCLREILERSEPNRPCYVSSICEEMMLKEDRIDNGYLLTHRLLYLQIIKLHGCTFPKRHWKVTEYITNYCSYIYKEAATSDRLNFPHYDIFLEQVVLCGMEGFAEFLNTKWLKSIMEWQKSQGCYESIGKDISKRTSFEVDFGCSDHTTGLGAASLALNLRYRLSNTSIFI